MNEINVYGKVIDDNTRCEHYHSALDIIAIKFKCCDKYYPCYQCHEQTADHAAQTWNKNEWDTKAILCGICKSFFVFSPISNLAMVCSIHKEASEAEQGI